MKSIPLPHSGPENPVAHDTKSEVPQEPAKQERAKKEPPPPKNAVELKSKTAKQLRAKVEPQPQPQHFKSFEELDPNKIKSQQAPAVSNPLFSEVAGSGRIGTGANTTLGTRFGAYSAQNQRVGHAEWRTGDVDASIRTGPSSGGGFRDQRDGTIGAPQIVQGSGIHLGFFGAKSDPGSESVSAVAARVRAEFGDSRVYI